MPWQLQEAEKVSHFVLQAWMVQSNVSLRQLRKGQAAMTGSAGQEIVECRGRKGAPRRCPRRHRGCTLGARAILMTNNLECSSVQFVNQ